MRRYIRKASFLAITAIMESCALHIRKKRKYCCVLVSPQNWMDRTSHPQLVGLRVGLEPVSWVVLDQRRQYVDPKSHVSRISSGIYKSKESGLQREYRKCPGGRYHDPRGDGESSCWIIFRFMETSALAVDSVKASWIPTIYLHPNPLLNHLTRWLLCPVLGCIIGYTEGQEESCQWLIFVFFYLNPTILI